MPVVVTHSQHAHHHAPIPLHESDAEDSSCEEGSVNIPLGFSAASAIDLSPLLTPAKSASPKHPRSGYYSRSSPKHKSERRGHHSSKRESRTRREFEYPQPGATHSPKASRGYLSPGYECVSPPDTPPPAQLQFEIEGTSSNESNHLRRVGSSHTDEVAHLRRDVESLTARTKELQRENAVLRRLLAAAEEKATPKMCSVGIQACDRTFSSSYAATPTHSRAVLRSPTVPLHDDSSASISPLPSHDESDQKYSNRRYSAGYALVTNAHQSPYTSRLRESTSHHMLRAPPTTPTLQREVREVRDIREGVSPVGIVRDGYVSDNHARGHGVITTRRHVEHVGASQQHNSNPSPTPYHTTTHYRVVQSPDDSKHRRSFAVEVTPAATRTQFYYS